MPSAQGVQALNRSYLLLARCFHHPSDDLYAALTDSRFSDDLKSLIESLPFGLSLRGSFAPSLSREDFEAEYINCFDLGQGAPPPCPLYESAHRDDLDWREIFEDLVRFFEHFDVKPNETARDYPDHLVAELEFIAVLAARETDAADQGRNPDSYRLAQLDFLERHLGGWVGRFNEKIQAHARERFYRAAGSLLNDLVLGHLEHLRGSVARVPGGGNDDSLGRP